MIRRVAWLGSLLALLVAGTAHAQAPDRYTLQGGCWSFDGIPGAEQVRLQATTLGSYLLYRPDRTFVTADPAPAAQPSPAAVWRVTEAPGGAFSFVAPGATKTVRVSPAQGCAVYPEAGLGATGTPSKGSLPYGIAGGMVEGHMHWMTYEYLGGNFHCGKPWDPYGIAFALPDCSSIEGPQGTAAPVQNFLNFGNPAQPHDTTGYPKLTAWGPGNLTYEGTYWRWIERAWMAGLRLMVMGVNENRILCQLQTNRKTNCNEMDTVRRGIADMKELQRYIDAQAGGPGKGFLQIVTDPFEARRVINEGKMAVVLEIEVSEPYDCSNLAAPTCNTAQVDRQLDEMYRDGVRSSLLLNKVDNPLTGVRFDGGPIGVLINGANKLSAGSFWSARTCTGPLSDNTIETFQPQANAFLDSALGAMGVAPGTVPAYPPAPHCNTRGLTDLGRHVVKRMMDLHMIVNPDHMSQAAVDDTLTLLETRKYSGVISPHGWMDPGNWPRLWKLGGMAFPGHSAAANYVKEWKKYRPKQTPFYFGWGYGADLGGLSHQPDPDGAAAISYPFKSYDGKVTFDRQTTGERTFDYNKDGVAHYGLYADWFEDLRRLGGQQLADDMWHGAEAYLEMWERASGVPSGGCRTAGSFLNRRGLGPIRLGDDWTTVLKRVGQPQQRARAWTWCVRGTRNRSAADVAVMTKGGKVELVGSTAHGRAAGGIPVGASAKRLRGAERLRSGLRVRGRYVYIVRAGRVRAIAVGARSAVRRITSAHATQTRPAFVPATSTRLTGQVLAGTSDPKLNSALALLCSL